VIGNLLDCISNKIAKEIKGKIIYLLGIAKIFNAKKENISLA
jgi:hypothetical protein